MEEQKKKRKWRKILLVAILLLLVAAGVCYVLSGGLLRLGQKAITEMEIGDKINQKIEAGELPKKLELPKEALEELTTPEPSEDPESQAPQQQPSGGVDYSQGIDLSYAGAIAAVASGADISLAYSTVLGCLSPADKSQIAAYLKNGQYGPIYSLVASRLTGSAYATLAGLYYKYLPMVQ